MRLEEFKKKTDKLECNVEYGFSSSNLMAKNELYEDNNCIQNRDIDIFYLIRKSTKNDAPYIIFFNGGPGIGFSEQFFEHNGYTDFLPEYNIVFMDQRGTGFSSRPSQNILEYKYFTSKYICYDAEQIRKRILGNNMKWIIFGQSFGGHVARKYMELYSQYATLGISHGYGECSIITMKANIEKQLFNQVHQYFSFYPEDEETILQIKSDLTNTDIIGDNDRCICGEYILDIFAIYFGLYSFEKIHEIISGLVGPDIKSRFLQEINYIGQLILKSGLTNMVVAFIDLVDGLTDEQIYEQTNNHLLNEGKNIEDELFSTIRLSRNVINKSEKIIEVEELFNQKAFKTDPINLQNLCNTLNKNEVFLYIIGSKKDTLTPIEAIKEEQENVSNCSNNKNYKFIYSDGNHREWRHNKKLLLDILNPPIMY